MSGCDSSRPVVSDVVRFRVREPRREKGVIELLDWLDLLTTVYYYSDDAAVTPGLAT